MAAGLAEAATSVGTKIGRYFSLASLLPSLVFVLWFVALRGGAQPFGKFRLESAWSSLGDWSPGKAGLVLASSVLLGVLVHPLLFGTTQLLEGYWGPRPFARRLAAALALRHRLRQHELEERVSAIEKQTAALLDEIVRSVVGDDRFTGMNEAEKKDWRARASASPGGTKAYSYVLARDSIKKVLADLPADADRILPTRLGNALRRTEDAVGKQYGLDLVAIAPHLSVAAAPARAAYLDDSREQLDVSVRFTFYGLLAAVLTTAWLLAAGGWLLLALIPYVFAFVSYRGAVASATEWGAAMATCVDLDRFALYDAMHVEWPLNTQAERDNNEQLMKLTRGSASASVSYIRRPLA